MNSSYNVSNLEFKHMFQTLIASINPKKVVEFGILEGYSLKSFVDNCDNDCQIDAYDIFEKFDGNGANKGDIMEKFGKYNNVNVGELDFYQGFEKYGDGSIDILHIDIANNGDVYKFVIDNYLPKINRDVGVIVLEGGSVERDNVNWMIKYNKPSIVKYLDKLKAERKDLIVSVIDVFPSMTIIRWRS